MVMITNLKGSDDTPPGGLKYVLVIPIRVYVLDNGCLEVVPPVEHDAKGQQGRVLVDARITQN